MLCWPERPRNGIDVLAGEGPVNCGGVLAKVGPGDLDKTDIVVGGLVTTKAKRPYLSCKVMDLASGAMNGEEHLAKKAGR